MYFKRIKLTTFMQFESFETTFESTNLFSGDIGSGKTTIALYAPLFCLWGYSPKKTLDSLPTKGKSKQCAVLCEIEHNNNIYIIEREYPLKLTITINGVIQKLSTADGNKLIIDIFGSRENFCSFRLLDAFDKSSNFLEAGSTTLKKIIFAQSDEIFTKVKENLTKIKNERETYQKSNIISTCCYPSERRLTIVNQGLSSLQQEYYKANQGHEKIRTAKNNLSIQLSTANNKINTLKNENNNLKDSTCFTCGQTIKVDKKEELIKTRKEEIEELGGHIIRIAEEMDMQDEIAELEVDRKTKIEKHIEIIKGLKARLELRLKQKDFKYSEKELIIAKSALEELDKLSSFYLKETIAVLEPIINSILDRIHYTLKFDVNEKGKFEIVLTKNGQTYSYQELSTGERLTLQLGIKMALLLEKNSDGIIICDEGMSALSKKALEDMLEFIQGFKMIQLFFVVHRYEPENPNINIITL